MVTRISINIIHYKDYTFSISRYDCTPAKSAIYFVIDTMEICVYISQNIHKHKMKAFNRTYSDIHQKIVAARFVVANQNSRHVSLSVYYFKDI